MPGELVVASSFMSQQINGEVLMSDVDHVAYFLARAAAERELARTAPEPSIASIHTQMAEQYDLLCEKPRDRNVLRVVRESPWSGHHPTPPASPDPS